MYMYIINHECSKIESVRLTCNQRCSRCASKIDDCGRVTNVIIQYLGYYMYCTLGERPHTPAWVKIRYLLEVEGTKTAELAITSLKSHIDCDGWVQY